MKIVVGTAKVEIKRMVITTYEIRSREIWRSYALAFAVNFTLPSATSTLYSTAWQPCCLRICSVFFCTNDVKLSSEPETCSPVFFLASLSAMNSFSTFSRSAPASEQCTTKGCSWAERCQEENGRA